MKTRYVDVANHKNTSSARGWSHLVPNVVGNCFPRKYGNDRKSGSDTSDGCSEEGFEVVKTTVSESQQQRDDRKRAEDFLLFMDKAKAPQLAPSPLLSRSAVSTVAYSDEKYHQEKKKPCSGRGGKPPLCTSSHFQKGKGVPSLDVGEKHPVVVGPVTTICPDEADEIIGETLCVVPPFLKGHSLAIKITLNDNIPKVDTRDSPLSFCVGLSTGPQLEQERGIMISFCSSRSEITHMRPRKVCSNTANSQSTEVEAVVISESRVLFHEERHYWIIWGEGLLFAGLGGNVGSRLLMAADTASPEYTFGYGAGATSVRERYSTDEVERIYVASRGPAGCAVEWQRVEVSSSWLNSPDRYSRALGKTCGWRTGAPTPSPYEKPQLDRCLHRVNEVNLLACIVDSRECALVSPNENPGASLAELAWWLRFVYRPESVLGPEASCNGGLGHAIEVEGIRWSGPLQRGYLRFFKCIGRCRWAVVRLGVTEKIVLTLLEKARHEFKEKGIFVEFQPCL